MKLERTEDGHFEIVEWGEAGCIASYTRLEVPDPITVGTTFRDAEGNVTHIVTDDEAAEPEQPTWITYFCVGDALHDGPHPDEKNRAFENDTEVGDE